MKRISLLWLVTHSLVIAMLGRKMLLQGCTSFGESDIFFIKLSGVPRLERVPPPFTFLTYYFSHCLFLCTLDTVRCVHFHILNLSTLGFEMSLFYFNQQILYQISL